VTRRSKGHGFVRQILGQVPLQQLASQLGVDESEVEQAARTALPALLGGLQTNAKDPAGAQSLASALSAHQGAPVSSLADIDESGSNPLQDILGQVLAGGSAGGSGGSASSGGAGDILGGILGGLLGGVKR
jgi:hypothetical protein